MFHFWYRKIGGYWIAYEGPQAIWEAAELRDLLAWLKKNRPGVQFEHLPLTVAVCR